MLIATVVRSAKVAALRRNPRIALTPDHVVLHDFETTIPKAVADLIAARG